MKISVVVPIYNTGVFLTKCIESIINQTFKDLEIICIDNNSTDNSLEILNEFQKKDNRIKIFTQENQSIFSARNKGIYEAKGEYISFINSTDWIDLNFYEKLITAIQNEHSDIAIANNTKSKIKSKKQYSAISLEEKIKTCDILNHCQIENKIYKTSIIKNFLFKNEKYYEDTMWLSLILKNSNKIVFVPDVNYYQRTNTPLISAKNNKTFILLKNF